MNTPHIISEEYFLAIAKIPNEAIQDVIVKLLLLGLSPIPAVPAQHYGGFVPNSGQPGKIPSYFLNGRLKLLSPSKDKIFNRLPTPQEIELWFADERIGIGSYGSSDGKKRWIDIDAKNFENLQQCEDTVKVWLKKNTNLGDAWIDRTGSGGYRVLVEFEHPPNFTTFSFKEGGAHVGECMKYDQFVVLAPSAHPNGNFYTHISGDNPGKAYSPEFVQIYQYTKAKAKGFAPKTTKPSATGFKPEHSNKPVDPEPFEVPTEWLHWEPLKQAEYIGKHPNCQWMFDDYDFWLKWGMVLHKINDVDGLMVWDELSQQSSKYKRGECCRKWGGFRKGNMGMGTLIHWGQQSGLIFPTGKGDRQAFRKSEGFRQWRECQRYTPDIIVDQQYLDLSEYVSADENQVFCVKSGLGTAKTTDSAKWQAKCERGSRELYPINDLALNTIERKSEITGKTHYHLRFDDDGRNFLADSNSHIHNCFDSLRKYSDNHFDGTDIYLDEAVAGLAHVANAETIGNGQASIIRKLNKGFGDCDSIFLMDGGLRDLECDLVAKKSGKKVVKILNKFASIKRTVTFITGVEISEDEGIEVKTKTTDITAICSLMIERLKSGHKLWVGTDSKNFSKQFYDLLVDDKSLKEYGFRVLMINSENAKEEYIKEFKRNPKKFLEQNHYDVVIFTPACAYGIDVQNPIIDGKPWFTEQYYIFRGAIGTLPQKQMMRRLRDNNVPSFVFCPERSSIPRDGVLGKTYTEQAYKQAMNKVNAIAAQVGSPLFANFDYYMQKVNEALNEEDKDWLEYSIKLQIIDNFEKENLKECLIYELELANYEITEVDIKTCATTKVMLEDAKDRVNVMDSNKVFNAPEVDEVQYKSLKKQAEKSDEERAIVEKYELLERLPGIKESELWSSEFIKRQAIEDNYRLIDGLELAEALKNPEKATQGLFTSWASTFTSEDELKGTTYKSSLSSIRQVKKNRKNLRILALNELGIPDLIHELVDGREITSVDDDIREIVSKWRESYVHKLGLYPEKPQKKKGKVIEGSETIPSIKKLLELVAFPLTKGKKKKVNGKVVVPYSADTEALGEHERCVIEECVARREEEKVAECKAKYEEKAQKLLAEGELITVVKSLEGLDLYEKLKELEQTKESLSSEIAKLSSELQAKINKAKALGALANQGIEVELSQSTEAVPSVREARQWASDQGLSSREIKILGGKLSPRASVPQKIFEFVELTKAHLALSQTERALLALETVKDEYELMEVMQEFPREKVEDAIDVLDTLEQRQKLRSMLVKAEKLVAC